MKASLSSPNGQAFLAERRLGSLYARQMDIKDWVRNARKAKGWTQQQLAERLARTKANIGHWETGKHEPSIEQLDHISRLTGHPLPALGARPTAAPMPTAPPPPSASNGKPFSEPTKEEMAFLDDFRVLFDTDREHYRREIAEKATQMRSHMEKFMGKFKGKEKP